MYVFYITPPLLPRLLIRLRGLQVFLLFVLILIENSLLKNLFGGFFFVLLVVVEHHR